MKNVTKVKYIGKVNLKLRVKDKEINLTSHNAGLPALQRSFCNFIIGNPITIEDIPEYLDLRKYVNGTWESCLLSKISLTGKSNIDELSYSGTDTATSAYIATFTAIISSTVLKELISPEDPNDYRLYLISGSLSDDTGYAEMAYLSIEPTTLANIGPGTQAIVEWSVQILV